MLILLCISEVVELAFFKIAVYFLVLAIVKCSVSLLHTLPFLKTFDLLTTLRLQKNSVGESCEFPHFPFIRI